MTHAIAPSAAPLFDLFDQLRRAWPGEAWGWEGRFKCVLSAFGSTVSAGARAAAAIALPHDWTSATLAQAPAEIRELASRSGGLRAGQLVLASPVAAELFAWGLWWPWSDGGTVSLRVGLGGADAPGLTEALRERFLAAT